MSRQGVAFSHTQSQVYWAVVVSNSHRRKINNHKRHQFPTSHTCSHDNSVSDDTQRDEQFEESVISDLEHLILELDPAMIAGQAGFSTA